MDKQPIEIALAVSMFALQVETLDEAEVKRQLIEMFTNLHHQKNKYEQQIRESWGIKPQPLQPGDN